MNIGQFKSINGQLLGSVATATLNLPRLGLRPVQSNNSRAPTFEIVALNPGKVWVQVGAVWEATNRGTGETFYQGRIDDPSMTDPLPVALFRNEVDGAEGYAIVWSRPQRRERDGFGGNGNGERRRQQADDGFGEGNATTDGQLANAGEVDENIPF